MMRATRPVLVAIAAFGVYVMTAVGISGQQGGPGGPATLVLTSYSTGDIAVPIPDVNTVDVPIAVSDTSAISDVNVSFRINHTFDGDLVIALVHPDGTIIPLATNRGGSGANFGTGANSSSGTPTVIDDEAATAISSGVAPFASTFRPESPLSALDGKPANGSWKLRVTDTAALDTGTIGVFSLQVTTICFCPEIQAVLPPVVVTEGINPANSVPDVNETVTVNLPLANVGQVNTTNLVATLQATGGVANPSAPQNYGAVIAGAGPVTRPFTFTANASCGALMTLTLALKEGTTSLGVITYILKVGTPLTPVTFGNLTALLVPATGTGAATGAPAAPYPSNITVSGIAGTIDKLTVRLALVNHTFPDDIDVLLVGPSGAAMVIMSDVGSGSDAVNATFTFDDSAASGMADTVANPTGTYRPTNAGATDAFPAPAPASPYLNPSPAGTATLASAFGGLAANGTWSLYVVDDLGGDGGNINGGWSLTITPSGATCQTATVPSTPTGAAATHGFSRATVTFNAAASNGGSAITGYTVVSNPAGGVDNNADSTGLSHLVTGLTNGISYTFRVRATNLAGNSPLSAISNSVTPPGLTDFPFAPGFTRVKAVHIIELRQRIDAQRIRFGLGGFSWTDPILSVGNTPVRAVHITDMRTALAQAYVAAMLTPPPYTDPGVAPGVMIKLIHIVQIQAALAAIE